MADTPEMFGPTRGFFGDGRFNGTMQNVVGPTFVAMATKFGLGMEIQSPTGLFLSYLPWSEQHYITQNSSSSSTSSTSGVSRGAYWAVDHNALLQHLCFTLFSPPEI